MHLGDHQDPAQVLHDRGLTDVGIRAGYRRSEEEQMELKTYLREQIDWEQPFPPEEYAARRKCVRDAMSKAGIDVLLLCRLPDINWLTGYDMIWNHLRNSTNLLIRADSDDTLFFRCRRAHDHRLPGARNSRCLDLRPRPDGRRRRLRRHRRRSWLPAAWPAARSGSSSGVGDRPQRWSRLWPGSCATRAQRSSTPRCWSRCSASINRHARSPSCA